VETERETAEKGVVVVEDLETAEMEMGVEMGLVLEAETVASLSRLHMGRFHCHQYFAEWEQRQAQAD